jgi:hypothetical protein
VPEAADGVIVDHPTACMWAQITVEPTNENPRCLRSRLNASESVLVAGISRIARQRLTFGRPPARRQP